VNTNVNKLILKKCDLSTAYSTNRESKRGTRKDPSWQDPADTDGAPADKLRILGVFLRRLRNSESSQALVFSKGSSWCTSNAFSIIILPWMEFVFFPPYIQRNQILASKGPFLSCPRNSMCKQ